MPIPNILSSTRFSYVALMAFLILIAWLNRFVQDDAFISFVYARDLVENGQLSWFGNHVEGYTNFSWVLLIALGMHLGVDPILTSYILGISSFATILVLLWHYYGSEFSTIAERIFLLAVFGSNYSVSSYATGGLETMFHTLLVFSSYIITDRLRKREKGTIQDSELFLFSVLMAIAIMTRPDSVVFLAVFGSFTLWRIRNEARFLRYMSLLFLPACVLLGAWLGWKYTYYESILPNTFNAKMSDNNWLLRWNGMLYLIRFANAYFLWPIILFALGYSLYQRHLPQNRLLSLTIFAWLIYIIYIGGDFMEFRMLIPITPLLAIALTRFFVQTCEKYKVNLNLSLILVLVILCFGSAWHRATFTSLTEDKSLDSIQALSEGYGLSSELDWADVGLTLKRDMGKAKPILALTSVGAIPYYSQLTTVDMWGLNEKDIVKVGLPTNSSRPGHRLHLPYEYLIDRGVNFLIGQPFVLHVARQLPESVMSWGCWKYQEWPQLPENTTILLAPIKQTHVFPIVYLQSTLAVDQAIIDSGWKTMRLSRQQCHFPNP